MKSIAARVVGVAVVLLLAAITGLLITSARTPQHEGKPLSEWLVLLDPQVERAADHEKAVEAIRKMKAEALPPLRAILHRRPNSIHERIRGYATRWHLLQSPKLDLIDEQVRAARAAHILAEDEQVNIAVLVPDLRYHFTNKYAPEIEAARALARAGPEGIACLTNFLAIGNQQVRRRAGWALTLDGTGRSQPGVQDALILSANSDPDQRVRANMVLYLSTFSRGGDTNRLVPLGLQYLKSEDGYNRWMGAMLLQNFRAMPEVRAALQAAASDSDERVRSVVARAFR